MAIFYQRPERRLITGATTWIGRFMVGAVVLLVFVALWNFVVGKFLAGLAAAVAARVIGGMNAGASQYWPRV
jgi:hypothetical protein